ncbi:MAG TPA: heme-binding domain-containing protein [Bacteroidales bacterium]|jgi:hypothetical protein|nr:heme-binding domain-containing protein [Bacteroidales bacterium]
MKAKLVIIAAGLILVIIQFLPSRLPENKAEDGNSLAQSGIATDPVLSQLRKSCFDCHSNQTRYPWYSRVAPVSWFISGHIREGREHLNFSEWETLSKRKKIKQLEDTADQIKSGEMPLKSYLLLHRDARLTKDESSSLAEWAENAASQILK